MNHHWRQSLGKFSVPWQDRGTEWILRVVSYLKERFSVNGYSSRADGNGIAPVVELQVYVEQKAMDTTLLIAALPGDEIEVWTCGSENANRELETAFLEAAQQATASLDEKPRSHKWSAIIGVSPSIHKEFPPRHLSENVRLAGLRFFSTERYFWSTNRTSLHTATSFSYATNVPIMVHGSSLGYSWEIAQPLAAETLGKAAAFLSLTWDTLIDVMESPTPSGWGKRQLPDHAPWLKIHMNMEILPPVGELQQFELPEWLDEAWTRLNRRTKMQTAMAMYMEGLRAENRHPSLALVSYVSAVETISLIVFREQRCKACRNHLHIGEKFFETLNLAVSKEQVDFLRPVYASRSKTVHTGRLHGTEMAPGAMGFSVFAPAPEQSFQWQMLRSMRQAVRSLLLLAIRGQLPERSSFGKR